MIDGLGSGRDFWYHFWWVAIPDGSRRMRTIAGRTRRRKKETQEHPTLLLATITLSHLCCHLAGTWNKTHRYVKPIIRSNTWFLFRFLLDTSVYMSPGWTSWGEETRCWWETQAGVQVWLVRSGSTYIVHGSFVAKEGRNIVDGLNKKDGTKILNIRSSEFNCMV